MTILHFWRVLNTHETGFPIVQRTAKLAISPDIFFDFKHERILES